jgi:BirA family biotin operon repressor/biotin-[acetyl-CoA-carboxylase] ligase
MLDESRLRAQLPVQGLGRPLYVFRSLGSTNDYAARLANGGAAEGTMVVADEQTEARGRAGRKWHTAPGMGLAFSLVLKPQRPETGMASGLGAVAVCQALEKSGLEPRIKWPNDVLLAGKKVAGILVEAAWQGEVFRFMVLGIGVNVKQEAVPKHHRLDFPAGSIEEAAQRPVEREGLLVDIVASLGIWYRRMEDRFLLEAWEKRLAYMGQAVEVTDGALSVSGRVEGLTGRGGLQLKLDSGERREILAGQAHLRVIDTRVD